MRTNPFKFGTIVADEYFTDRRDEVKYVLNFLNGPNHLLISSPRRFGKSSLILKCVKQLDNPWIYMDLQLITSINDFASQLLRRIYHRFPISKIKSKIKSFRVLPQINVNPLTNDYSVSFQPTSDHSLILEDIFNLIDELSLKKKIIFIFDEFQEIIKLGSGFDKQLRAHMQHLNYVNFIFLGSRESLVRDIFSKKNSPFYHFASLMQLGKIPSSEFHDYITEGLLSLTKNARFLSEEIVKMTQAHPYFTQQLAAALWQEIVLFGEKTDSLKNAFDNVVNQHDNDYERLWNTFNKTDKKILLSMAYGNAKPLSENSINSLNIGAPSTVFSSLKRLIESSYILKINDQYELEDPFFKSWIILRRSDFLN